MIVIKYIKNYILKIVNEIKIVILLQEVVFNRKFQVN